MKKIIFGFLLLIFSYSGTYALSPGVYPISGTDIVINYSGTNISVYDDGVLKITHTDSNLGGALPFFHFTKSFDNTYPYDGYSFSYTDGQTFGKRIRKIEGESSEQITNCYTFSPIIKNAVNNSVYPGILFKCEDYNSTSEGKMFYSYSGLYHTWLGLKYNPQPNIHDLSTDGDYLKIELIYPDSPPNPELVLSNFICENRDFQIQDSFPSMIYTLGDSSDQYGSFDDFGDKGCIGRGLSSNPLEYLEFCNGRSPEVFNLTTELTESDFYDSQQSQDGITFNFKNYWLSWNKPPYIKISSEEAIKYIKISGFGPEMYISKEPGVFTQKLNYSELVTLSEETKTYYINFVQSNTQIKIDYVDFGRTTVTNLYDQEVCEDQDTGEIKIGENIFDPSDIDKDALFNGGIINPPNNNIKILTVINEAIDIVTGEMTEVLGQTGNTCDMFNSQGDFMYSSNGTFKINLSLDSFNLPSAITSSGNFILKPINSLFNVILTTGAIFIPITENTEGKKFCLVGIVVEYQARPFMAATDYQYKMFLLDYFFLFFYYMFLFKTFYYIRHNTLISIET